MAAAHGPGAGRRRPQGAGRDMPVSPGIVAATAAVAVKSSGRESNVFKRFWRIFRATAWTMAAAHGPEAGRRPPQRAGRDRPVSSGMVAATAAVAVEFPGANRTFSRASRGFSGRPSTAEPGRQGKNPMARAKRPGPCSRPFWRFASSASVEVVMPMEASAPGRGSGLSRLRKAAPLSVPSSGRP